LCKNPFFQGRLINFFNFGYPGVLFSHLDETETVIFFDYNENKNYAMMDLNNPDHVVDLTPEVNLAGGYEGGFSSAYHKGTGKLYMSWSKRDTTMPMSTGQIANFLEVRDPETGQKIKDLEVMFYPEDGQFSEDGLKFFVKKESTDDETSNDIVYFLTIDTETDQILDSYSFNDMFPEAISILYHSMIHNKILVEYIIGKPDSYKGYLFVFNMNTRIKSKIIQFNLHGECALSADGSKILISEMNESNYFRDRNGMIYILDVEWPENENDDEILDVTDGITIQIPPFSTHTNMTKVIHTFKSNLEIFLISNMNEDEPFENSYLVRATDGVFLRGEPISTGLIINLLNSQNQPLTGGTLKYYEGGWREAMNNGDGTFRVETDLETVKLRMTYAHASVDMTDVTVNGGPVTFQTVPVQVELQDSQNQLMDEGSVKYYSGGWREFGSATGGIAEKELLQNSYKFRMTYGFASNDKTQNISIDPAVVFQTVPVQVELRDSQNQLMDEGLVKYYSGGWRTFGITSGGVAEKELLAKSYKFRMHYVFASTDQTQELSENETVTFGTIQTEVTVKDAQGNPVDGASVKYYSGGWREFGITSGGSVTKELLGKTYKFRATYSGSSRDVIQDVSVNPDVEIVLD